MDTFRLSALVALFFLWARVKQGINVNIPIISLELAVIKMFFYTSAMKNYSLSNRFPPSSERFLFPGRLHSPYRQYRRRALWFLALPLIMVILAFFVATWIVIKAPSSADFTGALKWAGFASYAYLILAFLYAPSYLAGFSWFLVSTRDYQANLKQRLMLMPVVSSFFLWCPIIFISAISMEDRIKVLFALIPVALVVGFCWSMVVHATVSYGLRKHDRNAALWGR